MVMLLDLLHKSGNKTVHRDNLSLSKIKQWHKKKCRSFNDIPMGYFSAEMFNTVLARDVPNIGEQQDSYSCGINCCALACYWMLNNTLPTSNVFSGSGQDAWGFRMYILFKLHNYHKSNTNNNNNNYDNDNNNNDINSDNEYKNAANTDVTEEELACIKKLNDDIAKKYKIDNEKNEGNFLNDQESYMSTFLETVANYENDAKLLEDGIHNSLTDQQNHLFSFDSEEVKAVQQLGITFEKQPSLWELILILLKSRKPISSLSKHLGCIFPTEITSEYSVYRYLTHDVLYSRLEYILQAIFQVLEHQSEETETKTLSIWDLMLQKDIEAVKVCINNLSAHKFNLPTVDKQISYLINTSASLIFYENCNANSNTNVNANSDVVDYD